MHNDFPCSKNSIETLSNEKKSTKSRRNRHNRHKVNVHNNHRKRFLNKTRNYAQNIKERNTYITNLSSKTLTQPQKTVLSLGLKFVPSRKYNKTTLLQSMMRFERSNRIKYFFRNEPEREKHPFHQISTWQPPKASQEIEAYLNRIKDTINDHTPRKMYPNLSQEEKQALNTTSQGNIIIKVQTRSGIVVETETNTLEAGKRHLSDSPSMRRQIRDPTEMRGVDQSVCTRNTQKRHTR